MIIKDFETGGFPISRQSPVICLSDNKDLFIAYNNYKLKQIFDNCTVIKCIGVWPGKINTDIFVLSTQYYGKIAPPVEHKDIDNAEKITLISDKNGEVSKLKYILNSIEYVSKDQNLIKYVTSAGRKYKTQIE